MCHAYISMLCVFLCVLCVCVCFCVWRDACMYLWMHSYKIRKPKKFKLNMLSANVTGNPTTWLVLLKHLQFLIILANCQLSICNWASSLLLLVSSLVSVLVSVYNTPGNKVNPGKFICCICIAILLQIMPIT